MVQFFIAFALTLICLLTIGLHKTYTYVPPRELKRQARNGDAVAAILFRAAAYQANLKLFLWIIIAASAAGSFVLLANVPAVPAWLAFIMVTLVVWYGFAWMPNGRLTTTGARLAVFVTPSLAWLLAKLQPILDFITSKVSRLRPITLHTGLYELDDLLDLLENQKAQLDSRISTQTIDLVMHALSFGKLHVEDVMIPRRVVRMVGQDDRISAILMDELHESGHSRFPVHDDTEDTIIGMLYMHDLVAHKQGGSIASVMKRDVRFVHEEHTLEQALHAFLKTKRHLFIVVNSFEEYTGIITIEDILEKVIGHQIVDEFDAYDDLRAVASSAALKEHKAHKKQEILLDPLLMGNVIEPETSKSQEQSD
jgi:CBS domain containing-hemolysin-like protein